MSESAAGKAGESKFRSEWVWKLPVQKTGFGHLFVGGTFFPHGSRLSRTGFSLSGLNLRLAGSKPDRLKPVLLNPVLLGAVGLC